MTDNELIAEFMGWRLQGEPDFKAPYEIWLSLSGAQMYPRTGPNGERYEEKFKYNSSWDWLMPVVEKIESLGEITLVHNKKCVMFNTGITVISETKIEAVYKACLDFIKNNQTP